MVWEAVEGGGGIAMLGVTRGQEPAGVVVGLNLS